MAKQTDWRSAFKLLIKKFHGRKHPLNYKNGYQLLVMVVLSAQTNDDLINSVTPALFKEYPDFKALANSKLEVLHAYTSKVRSFVKKSKWLVEIAKLLKDKDEVPLTMKELTALPGIGRKSASIITGELGGEMEGVFVDLHVVRVSQRLGIASETDSAEKIERKLMEIVPEEDWYLAPKGMTHLGREICRPADPDCPECPMNTVCAYYRKKK